MEGMQKECLPTTNNLKLKHVEVEDQCCFCKSSKVDDPYALFYCPQIQREWNKQLPLLQNIEDCRPIMDIAMLVREKGQESGIASFFLVASGFWYRRIKMIHNRIHIAPKSELCCFYADD